MRATYLLLFAGLSVALVTSSTRAEAADPATADALFLEGRRAVEAGNYPLACAKFEESNRLDPAPGTLLNLADCEENRGQLAHAWQHFKQLYDELPPSDERRGIADHRARSLERRTPKLRIVPAFTSPAMVKRDDTVLDSGSLGVSEPVDPGRHVIVVSSPGRWDRRYELEIGEGQAREVSVAPGEPQPAEPIVSATPTVPPMPPSTSTATSPSRPLELPATLPPASEGDARRTTAYVLGGVGAASLLTGAAFGVAALSDLSASNAHCTGDVCASQEALNQFHAAQSFAHVADVTIGVAAVCLVTAVVLGITDSRRSNPGGEASLPPWLQGRF